jgi:hypothetical protein
MSILFAGNFASLLGLDSYHSTASTGRDAAYTDAQVELPQAGEHAIGFSLDLSQTSFPDIWLHCRMHATQSADFGNNALIFYVSDNAQSVNRWFVEKNNVGSSYQYRAVADGTATSFGSYWGAASATTYSLDFRANRSGSNMTAEFYVNGGLVSSVSRAANSSSQWVSASIRNGLGRRASGSNPIYVSEIILATSSTIGKRVATLRPSSAGHYAEWTGSPGSVNDFDTTTGITASSTGLRQTRVHTAAPAGTVEAVMPVARMTPVHPARASSLVRIGGTDYLSASPIAPGGPNGPSNVWRELLTTNPATGQAWTTADLAALDAGFRSEPAA